MTNPKSVFAKESVNLIKKLTGFTEEEENFGICENFVLSNLLYHSYLDPVPSKIEAHLKGLSTKWEIQAKEGKASRLKALVEKFITDPLFNSSTDPMIQFDIHYRMLSLAYNLSNSDSVIVSPFGSEEDSSSLSKSLLSPEPPKPLQFWLDLLGSGEAPYRFPVRDDELSSWSDTSPGSSEGMEDLLPLDKSSGGPSNIIFPAPLKVETTIIPFDSLASELQPRYWELSSLGVSSFPTSFLSRHEKLCAKAGISRPLKIVVSEYQIIREILWMLRRPSEGSLIFKRDKKQSFSASPYVSIPSLAAESLTMALSIYTPLLDDIRILLDFLAHKENIDEIPHTYEAYGEHLRVLLSRFSSFLIEIEDRVASQEGTYTLLDLETNTRAWRKLLSFVAGVHSKGITMGPNWYRAIRLISVLNESLGRVFKGSEFEIAAEGLLRTLRPYLRIADTWISEGRLEDWRNEFVYMANPELKGQDERFWEDAFVMHDYEAKLREDGIAPPRFLPFKKIHISGKSRHVLIFLHYVPKSSLSSVSIYEEFISKLKSQLRPIINETTQETKVHSLKHEGEIEKQGFPECSVLMDDPYLSLAFKEVEEKACSTSLEEKDIFFEEKESQFLLRDYDLDPLKSFEPLIFSSLDPIIHKQYTSSCARILEFFQTELKLEAHLSSIRKVFLMEDGDICEDFYSDIFTKMDERDSLYFDASNLTLHLRGCLSLRNRGHSPERFRVCLGHSGELLDTLQLSYHLDWPLNIVISTSHFDLYNKVFQFLIKIKHALWALKVISPSSILSQDKWKIKKILLLRAWLFHFVGSIHSHIMTRVLHSTEVELRDALSHAKDLDDVIQCHSDYINQIVDRCFLLPNTSILRNTVLKVLRICSALKELVHTDETEDMSSLLNLEEVYSRSHQFLAITLNSILQKRNLPHLESLAVALVHSCPETL